MYRIYFPQYSKHSPSPKGVWISIDPLVVGRRETDNPPKVFWIVRVPIPAPCDVMGNRREPRIGLVELCGGEKVDVVKEKDVVLRIVIVGTPLVFAGQVEANVEKLAPVELSLVVGLFHNVNMKVGDCFLLVLEVSQKLDHVRDEFRQVLRSFLFGMQVPKRHNDRHARRVGHVQERR